MKFIDLPLVESIQKGIDEVGFIECTPVQEETLKISLEDKDVLAQSKTGTGKTAAFLITIFQLFLRNDKYKSKKALILAPTRELAVQIEAEAKLLGKYCGLKIGCFYGGVGYAQQEKLSAEGLNIYIGTPGRLIDFYKSKKIDFLQMDIVVIDEADRMFDMGFIKDIKYIMKKAKPPQKRLTMLYSATLSYQVKSLSWDLMNDPQEVVIETEEITADNITQEIYHISKRNIFSLLLTIIKKENPTSVLIFTNTKRDAEEVSGRLKGNGFEAEYISGDLPQSKRLSVIEAVKNGKIKFIVATDVAARGLHIDDLQLVINYDLPQDSTTYVHRIGRTARAGKSGKAISLACEDCIYNLEPIEKLIGRKLPEIDFENSELVEDVSKPDMWKSHRPKFGRDRSSSQARPHQRPIKSGTDYSQKKRIEIPKPAVKISPAAEVFHVAKPHATKENKAPMFIPDRPLPKQNSAPVKRPPERPVQTKPVMKKEPVKTELNNPANIKVSRNLPLKERIALYEKKYGKDFVAKKGLFKKLFSFFTK